MNLEDTTNSSEKYFIQAKMYAVIVAKRITADADTAPGLTVSLQRSVAQAQTPMNLPQLVSSALKPQLFAVAVNPKRPSKERSS